MNSDVPVINSMESPNAENLNTCFKPSAKNSRCVIGGADLCKFYNQPVKNSAKPGDLILQPDEDSDTISCLSEEYVSEFLSTGTQTDFRESETQTDPWDPPYKVISEVEPKVLLFKDLTYGNGLPATYLEVEHILETLENRKLCSQSSQSETEDEFLKRKQMICNQVRNEWNYKISTHSLRQMEKLKLMEIALTEELNKHSEKQDKLLQSKWNKKKCEMQKLTSKLQKDLHKELRVLDPKGEPSIKRCSKVSKEVPDAVSTQRNIKRRSLHEQVDYLLSNYYICNQAGLASIKDWLERKKTLLHNEIPLAKPLQRSIREKLSEKAFQDLLVKKRTKLPPKIYHEDYDKEESPPSSVKSEVEFEILELPDEGIDLVTIWQQVLRGRAYQKQMLELIEKHRAALELRLSHQLSGKMKAAAEKCSGTPSKDDS